LNILIGYPPSFADSETQFADLRSLWAGGAVKKLLPLISIAQIQACCSLVWVDDCGPKNLSNSIV
jgi:hypothetical protein